MDIVPAMCFSGTYTPNNKCLQTVFISDMSCDMTKPTKWLCTQQRLRSAWASAQSDQSIRRALIG